MSNFARNLPLLRRRAGLTQEGLAEALEVSRQAVSKWESGQTMPESEKLLPLAELLDCSLDQLFREELDPERLDASDGEVKWTDYAAHMDRFARCMAVGSALTLLGVAALLAAFWALGESVAIVLPLLFCEAGAVFLLVSGGLAHSNFLRTCPFRPDCADLAAQERFLRRFPFGIAGAVAGIMMDVAFLLALAVRYEHQEQVVAGGTALFFVVLALCVGLLVLLGVKHSKYQERPAGRDIGGAVMLLATACFLVGGFLLDAWKVSWAAFPVGGLLCAALDSLGKKDA